MTTSKKASVSSSTDSEQDQVQATSFDENSTNQVQLVTPTDSPIVGTNPPVRRRLSRHIGPLPTVSTQQEQSFAELPIRSPEVGPFNFINLTTAVEAKLDPMGLSGIAKLKKKKVLYKEAIEEINWKERLIKRELTKEVQDTNARDFRIIDLALRNLQREINASAEETCGPPTKFQRSGSPSNDGDPGNSSASHMKASPPKMACLSAKNHVMTTAQLPPIPVRNGSSDVVALVVAGVGVTVAATLLYWIKVWSEKK